MHRIQNGIALILFSCAAFAQNTTAKPQFDVVSIKAAAPPGGGMIRIGPPSGGPGTKDPTRFTAIGLPLVALLMQAYEIQPYQLNGPSWLMTERFDIIAKMPEQATKEQFHLMLQSMLEERFKMVAHREKKDSQVYDLVVGKNGHKMKPSASEPPGDTNSGPPPLPPGGRGPLQMGSDGFPVMPRGGRGPMMIMMNGRAKMQAVQVSMAQLATTLTNQLGKPVTDATGLQGNFEFTLYFSPEGLSGPMGMRGMLPPAPPPPGAVAVPAGDAPVRDVEPGPNLFAAVQDQLGLKLEPKKGQIDMLVIDKMEKVPTEN